MSTFMDLRIEKYINEEGDWWHSAEIFRYLVASKANLLNYLIFMIEWNFSDSGSILIFLLMLKCGG